MLITAIILGVYVFLAILGLRYTKDSKHFFNKDYTTNMKGLCCIIVIFVHIPAEHGNVLQDAIGSFAYICVTLFFMFSAYGLSWSVKHKNGYLSNFIRNRILVLLTPFLIISLLMYICGFYTPSCAINFVRVLLVFYIVFYLSYKFVRERYRDILICGFVLLYSLIGRIAGDTIGLKSIGLGWYTESLGFMYGIIFANILERFKEKTEKNYVVKVGILTVMSGILGISYLKYKYVFFAGDYLLKIILAISLILLLFTLTIHFKVGNTLTKYLGKVSYEIFLLHPIVIILLNRANVELSSGIYILFVFIGTIILATGLNKLDVYISKKISSTTKPFETIIIQEVE